MSEKGQGTFMLSDSETFPVAVALAIWSLWERHAVFTRRWRVPWPAINDYKKVV